MTAALEDFRLWRTCPGCVFFDDKTEVCKIAGVRPPARVIALGCDSMFSPRDNVVPF